MLPFEALFTDFEKAGSFPPIRLAANNPELMRITPDLGAYDAGLAKAGVQNAN